MNKGHTAKLLVLLHEQLEHRGPPDSVDEGGDEAVPYAVYADAARKTIRAKSLPDKKESPEGDAGRPFTAGNLLQVKSSPRWVKPAR